MKRLFGVPAKMKKLGDEGERLAERFLRRHGYKILARNYRCHFGEIDIIARDGEIIAFVEVKARSSKQYGSAFEAITAGKMQRLARVARHYLAVCGLDNAFTRFDVVGIQWDADGMPESSLIKDAFRLTR